MFNRLHSHKAEKNILRIRPVGFLVDGRVYSDAESLLNHGYSVRHSIELIGKTRKTILPRPRGSSAQTFDESELQSSAWAEALVNLMALAARLKVVPCYTTGLK